MNVSFQLYSAREHGPWSAVYKQLAALGYTLVEGYGGVYEDPAATARGLAANGLSMPTGHFAFDLLERDPHAAFAIARTLGCTTIYCPFLLPEQRPEDASGWRGIGRRLAEIGRQAVGEGFGFGWHNHAFEFEPTADGTVPLSVIFEEAPDISWEADLAWIVRANADPAAWVRSHGSRITAVHVKDVAPAGECVDEDGWSDPGNGTMDWPGLLKALDTIGTSPIYIVEHDKPADLERFAKQAITFLKSHENGKGVMS